MLHIEAQKYSNLEIDAKLKGYKSVRLESTLNAKSFYTASGYQVTQRNLFHFFEDHPVEVVLMSKHYINK